MKTFLAVLLILAMLATLVALLRGIIEFLRSGTEDVAGNGPNLSGERQNRMMRHRIFFQAIAIVIIVLLLLLARH